MASANNPGGDNIQCADHHLRLVRAGSTLVDTVFHGYQLNSFVLDLPNGSVKPRACNSLAFDLTTTRIGAYNAGTHEIMLSYDLKFTKGRTISPRYF
jgi:hypothetical protein